MKYKHLSCGQTFKRPNSNGQYTCPKCKGWMCNCEECDGTGYEVVYEPKKLWKRYIKKIKKAWYLATTSNKNLMADE